MVDGPTKLYLVTELGAEVVRTDHFYAFASTRVTAAMAYGIEVSGRFIYRLIRVVP